MSSYYPSFSYTAPNGKRYNSFKDKRLIVVHFESGDSGEVDTFLTMESVYTNNTYGTRRFDYGAKYNSVAKIRISVMKANGRDFTVPEVRDFLRWTTGSRTVSYLDLSTIVQNNNEIEEVVQVQFLGRITAVYQQKLDARTIGFVIEHESVSPYAYSPIQNATCHFEQTLLVDESGVLTGKEQDLYIDNNGVVSGGTSNTLSITNGGTVHFDNTVNMQIYNNTDDLSSYVYMDMTITNNNSDHVIVKNSTIYEDSNGNDGITEITGMKKNEVITLTSNQFITSSSNRSLGSGFNFIWPKLIPGVNQFIINGTGSGTIDFKYRYPIKIGDCAINMNVSGDGLYCGGGNGDSESDYTSTIVTWDDILNKPSTIDGYGIVDAYTIYEIDDKFNNINICIDEAELNEMLEDTLEDTFE